MSADRCGVVSLTEAKTLAPWARFHTFPRHCIGVYFAVVKGGEITVEQYVVETFPAQASLRLASAWLFADREAEQFDWRYGAPIDGTPLHRDVWAAVLAEFDRRRGR